MWNITLKWKETNIGDFPFSTSMIMGGRVYSITLAFTLCPLHSSRARDKTSAKWLQTLQPSMCCRLPWHRNYTIFYFMRSAGNPEDETWWAFENRHHVSCNGLVVVVVVLVMMGGRIGVQDQTFLSMFVWSSFHRFLIQVVALLLRTGFLYFFEISSLCFLDSWMLATQHTCIYLGADCMSIMI